jgi:hypothetical protein
MIFQNELFQKPPTYLIIMFVNNDFTKKERKQRGKKPPKIEFSRYNIKQ